MKKIFSVFILTVIIFSLRPVQSSAQALGHSYRTGVGVKMGYWGGGSIDVKHFLNGDSKALEGMLSFGHHWFTITGLYEFHGKIPNAPGLQWYAGPGAHFGFETHRYHDRDRDQSAFLGIDGVLGMAYKFNHVPIDISLDIQPAFSFPDPDFGIYGGLGIRFTF